MTIGLVKIVKMFKPIKSRCWVRSILGSLPPTRDEGGVDGGGGLSAYSALLSMHAPSFSMRGEATVCVKPVF